MNEKAVDSIGFAIERGYFSCENNVFNLPIPTIEKLIYLALTRYAGSNNRAWPSYSRLGKDASCSRRRAIDAVNALLECGLIDKLNRGNRTNVYLLYPPGYYRAAETVPPEQGAADAPPAPLEEDLENNFEENFSGEQAAPPDSGRVNLMHPGSAGDSPPGCTPCTVRVNEVHPKINKKNNNDHQHLKEQSGAGHRTEKREDIKLKEEKAINPDAREKQKSEKREKLRDETQGPPQQTVTREMIEAVHAAFKNKGFQATDNAARQLLKDYGETAVKAAIRQTDFNVARNPLAVINWMLATDSYVLPVGKTPPAIDREERTNGPTPKELFEIKKMINETKANLLKKRTAQLV